MQNFNINIKVEDNHLVIEFNSKYRFTCPTPLVTLLIPLLVCLKIPPEFFDPDTIQTAKDIFALLTR